MHRPTGQDPTTVRDMVNGARLAVVLSEFARTLGTDYSIQGILDHLAVKIVDLLPITAAGLTLIEEAAPPRYVAASDTSALLFEQLQTQLGEGPGVLACHSGEAVEVPDLASDLRFPHFRPLAVGSGLAAVHSFPLVYGASRLGSLDLYSDTPGGLDVGAMAAAQTLADVTVAYLLNARARGESQVAAEGFRHSSLHDTLTGLPNRELLRQRLGQAARHSAGTGTYVAVLFADLDGFKRVNDQHGHRVGDELLRAVTGRLSHLVRPGDTLCRYSGDEFVILCQDMAGPHEAELLAARIAQAFSEPFALNDLRVAMTASVGLACAEPGEEISDRLVMQADTAMYQAKRKGGAAHQTIDLSEAARHADRVLLEDDLRASFARDELSVAYQPIVRSSDGLVTGVEVLLRWDHPTRGPVSPVRMIDIAEQDGLISALGRWVLTRACVDHAGWASLPSGAALDLAVNVSAPQLLAAGFCSSVAEMLRATGTDPRSLVLELTEYLPLEDSERAVAVLAQLRGTGIRIALNDFGTGYSAYSYLQALQIDILKVDQAFIARIPAAPDGPLIAEAVSNLAHALGLSVTAEGVETEHQRDTVVAIGCESAQGFYFARPMTAGQLGELLAASRAIPVRLPCRPAPARSA